jgi:ribosomal protein L37E
LFDGFKKTDSGLYLRHAEQNKWLGKSKMTEGQLLKEYGDNPICPRCERPAFRDKGWKEKKQMQCNHCGYSGTATMTVREYMQNQMYK